MATSFAVGAVAGIAWRYVSLRAGWRSRIEWTRMMSYFASPKYRRTWLRSARLAIASLAAVITAGDHAGAANGRNERTGAFVESRTSPEPIEPIMAIVSLRNQRITVYDAKGWILRAPVSSGRKGRETPAGIFSVIQKEAEHYSNLYDDAYMPHMQRITRSGIALHGGPLPGHPASHGCVRMPYDFAARLFGATRLGMRVIVAPSDVAPVEIAHPALFSPKPGARAIAAARAAEADEAASKSDQARLAAVMASREAARAMMPVVENLKLTAEAQLAAAERAVSSAGSAEAKEQAEDAKAKAVASAAGLQAQWAAATAELQPKFDAVASAREAAVAAETARLVAAEAARKVALELEPVSVFISRKTQRLYVRQAFQPILESPVTIRDPHRPIGTHVFTAIERTGNDVDMRWSVVSLNGGHADAGVAERHGPRRGRSERDGDPISTDPVGAKAALDRIAIPQDALDRIAGIASPRSSLIISDEALSSETGEGTEFVVLMTGEPQGGIKFRRRGFETEVRYERPRNRLPYWPSPFAGRYSTW
jgi:L,D-transpeptidase catalytic domain